jgi:hypothetical protein
MGYDYCFYLSVDNLEQFSLRDREIEKLYRELMKLDWFPKFGKTEHSGSKGYGVGPNEHLLPEFMKFTSKFPDFTFRLWLSHWDNTNLYMVEVKNDQILSTFEKSFETVEILPGVTASLNIESLNIQNDITEWFTSIEEEPINENDIAELFSSAKEKSEPEVPKEVPKEVPSTKRDQRKVISVVVYDESQHLYRDPQHDFIIRNDINGIVCIGRLSLGIIIPLTPEETITAQNMGFTSFASAPSRWSWSNLF